MFDVNIISEPGIQKDKPDSSWSFLYKRHRREKNSQSIVKQKTNSVKLHNNSLKYYVIVLLFFGLIAIIETIKLNMITVNPDLVLNQVIDLIIESSFLEKLKLEEANFSNKQVKVTIRSKQYSHIQSLIQGYRMEDEIPYQIYTKGEISYLDLMFPWKAYGQGGDIDILKAMANKTVFSNKISINESEETFEIHGRNSDIISFLLEMAENNQIQQFNFSVFHEKSGRFILKVHLNLI